MEGVNASAAASAAGNMLDNCIPEYPLLSGGAGVSSKIIPHKMTNYIRTRLISLVKMIPLMACEIVKPWRSP
jgi:hypothetical protein